MLLDAFLLDSLPYRCRAECVVGLNNLRECVVGILYVRERKLSTEFAERYSYFFREILREFLHLSDR